MTASKLVVSSHGDYYTFRGLADVLSKKHQCHHPARSSRVAFSPSFNTTQTGFSASHNMNIMFSYLADLALFLLARDDNVFETIFFKEDVSGSSTLLRILGFSL